MAPHVGLTWPEGIPLEIFSMIFQYIPDRERKALRLVNQEFNSKLISIIMRQVVICVSPGFSTKMDASRGHDGSHTLIDFTQRLINSPIAQCYGPQIRRLGIALDLNEIDIASPAICDLEDIVVRPWGPYRWPIDPEDRGSAELIMDNIIDELEKSQGQFNLLDNATNLREIALSCEGGLGYLQGPDVNPRQPQRQPPVFGKAIPARETDDESLQILFDKSYKIEMSERKMAAQGVDPSKFPTMIYRLLMNEEISLDEFSREQRQRSPLPLYNPAQAFIPRERVPRDPKRNDRLRLQPGLPVQTQLRFIYRHIQAEEALILSFFVGFMDKCHLLTNLTKLNITRISSFHLDSLCRHDFWTSVPSLNEVALGVIPEWTSLEQRKGHPIEARQVYPTDAIPKVFKLLSEYIGKQRRIKRLHFEWHCGGELAAGCVQRNRYILPAPFLKNHRKVIDCSVENLLFLPYVTHLSLKNCWFAPHVFYCIIYTMGRVMSIEELVLESVSLSGPPILQPGILDIEPEEDPPNTHWRGGTLPQIPLPKPEYLSWLHIIDMLTPGVTVKELQYLEEWGEFMPPLRIKKELSLRKIVFISCGYVEVRDYRFISNRRFRDLKMPDYLEELRDGFRKEFEPKRQALREYLQLTTDRHLAKIVPVMSEYEKYAMKRVFGLETGWNFVYDRTVIEAAQRDGVVAPGIGRFSGTIEGGPPREDNYKYEPDPNVRRRTVDYYFDTTFYEQGYNDLEGLDNLMQGIEAATGYSFVGPVAPMIIPPWVTMFWDLDWSY
ncbi:uncharacterized protein F4822DRAFT_182259 [Hypoxylon trugodes]|uniref:uncharacterized protein n=1 Tax=Hypoxylon trugodes TaxID=326681 RepID=UPI00219BD77D|nr:uncharacterized protein F4822DRAFT_182259 [Hypoxylon trugodes]KAI1391332.1 hypothetical protein F4822DRAFT_182259 [Hypoxylon trugodes]